MNSKFVPFSTPLVVNHVFLFVVLALVFSLDVSAQTLEEIVVTAQKREQSIQDIGISVTAFTKENIRDLGFSSTIDVAALTPGMQINTTAGEGNKTNVVLRGVGLNDFVETQEGAVALYVDEAYVASTSGIHFTLFDVERAEVLRGPQGTLFGRNATGGLIHFITTKPTDEFEAYVNASYGSYDEIRVEGALSGPITDNLLGRLSVARHTHDGYMENIADKFVNDINFRAQDKNEGNASAIRGQLLWNINDDADLWIKAHYFRHSTDTQPSRHGVAAATDPATGDVLAVGPNQNPYGTCNGCDRSGFAGVDDFHTIAEDFDGRLFVRRQGVTARLNWNFDNFSMTAISDYLDVHKDLHGEEGSPFPGLRQPTSTTQDQFMQELRFSGERERMRWTLGGFYLHREGDTLFRIDLLDNIIQPPLPNTVVAADSDLELDSWAVFGQVEYDLLPDWTFIAGLRYYDEKQDFIHNNFVAFHRPTPFQIGQFDCTTFPDDCENDFQNVTAKVEIDWRPNKDLLVFASFNRGVKSGNFNAPSFPLADPTEMDYDEEILHAWEVGFKSDWFGGSTRLNASAWYYDYDQMQTRAFSGFSSFTFNVDAEIYGADVEFSTSPWKGFGLTFSAGFLEGEAKDILFDAGPNRGQPRDVDIPSAPSVTLGGLARYEWSALRDGTMAIALSFHYRSSHFHEIQNHTVQKNPGYIVGNARVSYTNADESLETGIIVKNFADEEYASFIGFVGATGTATQFPGRPQWIQGFINLRWD